MALYTIERGRIRHTHTNMYGVEVTDAEYPPRYVIGKGLLQEEFDNKKNFLKRIRQLRAEGFVVERDETRRGKRP